MIYNADCLEVLKDMADESVDCVVTDCPYKMIGCGTYNDRPDAPSGILSKYREETRSGKYFANNDIEFDEWLPEVYRVLKDKTHCYIMTNARNLKDLWVGAEKVGFVFQNLLIWDKGNATPNKYYMQAYELILMLRKGGAKYINDMGTNNILRVPNITRVKLHPTEKPVELMEVLVRNSTNENDVVMDLFMGAGATGVACKELKRRFIGIEIDEKYFEIAKQRIEGRGVERTDQIEGQTNIFDLLEE